VALHFAVTKTDRERGSAVGKTSKTNGSFLQSDDSAAGFFQGTNQTSFVTIESEP
jgi:hypothetical protein